MKVTVYWYKGQTFKLEKVEILSALWWSTFIKEVVDSGGIFHGDLWIPYHSIAYIVHTS